MSKINFVEVIEKEVVARDDKGGLIGIKSRVKNQDGKIAVVNQILSVKLWEDPNIDIDKFILDAATEAMRIESSQEEE